MPPLKPVGAKSVVPPLVALLNALLLISSTSRVVLLVFLFVDKEYL
jgi:hypothetical protein